MKISEKYYGLFSQFIGLLLLCYGGGALAAYIYYISTGINIIHTLTNGMGLVFLSLMGAFPFPVGVALLLRKGHTSTLMLLAAIGLAINALIRAFLMMSPEVIEITGGSSSAPSGESLVFAALAALTFFIQPSVAKAHNDD